jgi:hypothetical protein
MPVTLDDIAKLDIPEAPPETPLYFKCGCRAMVSTRIDDPSMVAYMQKILGRCYCAEHNPDPPKPRPVLSRHRGKPLAEVYGG